MIKRNRKLWTLFISLTHFLFSYFTLLTKYWNFTEKTFGNVAGSLHPWKGFSSGGMCWIFGTIFQDFLLQKSDLFKKREFFRFWKLCFCLLLLKRMSSCATSFACADFDVAITFFTLNETTPMKLAFATFDSSFSFGFKATIATHLVATFRTISFLQSNEKIINFPFRN